MPDVCITNIAFSYTNLILSFVDNSYKINLKYWFYKNSDKKVETKIDYLEPFKHWNKKLKHNLKYRFGFLLFFNI